jgi:hypothetical protein
VLVGLALRYILAGGKKLNQAPALWLATLLLPNSPVLAGTEKYVTTRDSAFAA